MTRRSCPKKRRIGRRASRVASVNRCRKAMKAVLLPRRAGTKLKRSRRFRMRGSASYFYPTHSKQMNHVPKWPTEFRRHVASAHANQRVHGTHAHAAATRTSPSRRAGPGRAEPGWAMQSKEHRLHVVPKNFTRTKRRGLTSDCSCTR